MTHFSLIVPVLDEAAQIQQRLEPLQDLRQCGHEVIVVDGGSVDGSLPLAQSLADRILTVARGRARQMNAGARVASNEWLLFLHLDTELPESAAQIMANDIAASGREWGWFDVQLANPGWPYRVIAWHMNRRARLTRVCTGQWG